MNPYEPAEVGGVVATNVSAVASIAAGLLPSTVLAGDLILLFINTSGATVTAITQGVGVQDAWSFIGRQTGTGINVEVWMSRAVGGAGACGTASFSASTSGHIEVWRWSFPKALTSLPSLSVAAAGATGNSTSPGGVPVAVGGVSGAGVHDLLIELIGWNSTAANTAVTDSPSSGTQPSARWGLMGAFNNTVHQEIHEKTVHADDPAGNYSRAVTIAATTQWAAMAFALAGPPPGDATITSSAVMAFKGRDTATADQANAA